MIVSEIAPDRFDALLPTRGIRIETGPFAFRITSSLPELAAPLRLLYADFPAAQEGFVDFHLVLRPSSILGLVRGLAEILIDGHRVFGTFPRRTALPHTEWALNWWVYCYAHRFLIIHAAVVDRAGQAALLSAPPGSGKSTLCAALVARGWRLLSDELALIQPEDGRLRAIARPISLKNESIDVMTRFAPGSVIGPITKDTQKGTVAHLRAPRDSVSRVDEASRPRWIVFPKYLAGSSTQIAPVPKARAFMELAINGFNYRIMGAQGFETLADAIEACGCYALTYSDLDEAVAALADLQ